MDNSSSLKQVAQNILDTSYKIYSDVSLINSSLFRAASSLGVELPEIPQISLAETREKLTGSTVNLKANTMEKLSAGKKIPLFGVDKKTEKEQISTEKQRTPQPILRETSKEANAYEEKINKIANELPPSPNYKPGNLEENRPMVAATEKPQETKVSMEEKEAKLDKLQAGMPTKVNVVNKPEEPQLSPFEAISHVNKATSQSELQKKIFETTNFGKSQGKVQEEEVNEIANNPLNKLLALIKERHSITTSQAAQSLNVSKDLIDRWAKILSQNSLIRIKYQLMGDTILEA
ncbi:hypothetical protein M1137_02295 [Candidatus Parvarchaeota archaeon]|jgi:hypothetical protein|nr:hypothetical protein [Candidatus Parvarchaeota archaeon]